MKKVIKLLTVCLAVFASLFIVTACGGGDNGGGHTHDYTASTQVVNPTCKSEGYTKHICSCGEYITDNSVPSVEHVLDDDRNCTTCDKKASEGLRIVNGDFRSLSTCEDTEIIIPKGVTSINNGALKGKTEITAIYIPKTVTQIGDNAFLNCSNLKKVIFEDGSELENIGDSVFKGCSALEYYEFDGGLYFGSKVSAVIFMGAKDKNASSISIKDGCKIIYESVYRDNKALEEITIPNTVKTIGDMAFYECSNLKKANYLGTHNDWAIINFGDGYSNPSYYANGIYFNGEYLKSLSLSAEKIKDYAFVNFFDIEFLTIENTVKEIGKSAFTNSVKLLIVNLGTGLENIGDNAFNLCDRILEIKNNSTISLTIGGINNGSIAKSAKNIYSDNSGVSKITNANDFLVYSESGVKSVIGYTGTQTEITLPSSVSKVGPYSFYRCFDLTSVVIPEGIVKIEDYAFASLKNITEITIPNSVTEIGKHAFDGCVKVETLTFGTQRKLTHIDDYGFANLTSLKKAILPDGLKRTGDYSFENCSSMTEFSMPSSIEELAWRILNGCHLEYIYFRGVNMINDNGRSLNELAQNTRHENGVMYYWMWYYNCGTAFVRYPTSNGINDGEYDFEQDGRLGG